MSDELVMVEIENFFGNGAEEPLSTETVARAFNIAAGAIDAHPPIPLFRDDLPPPECFSHPPRSYIVTADAATGEAMRRARPDKVTLWEDPRIGPA